MNIKIRKNIIGKIFQYKKVVRFPNFETIRWFQKVKIVDMKDYLKDRGQ